MLKSVKYANDIVELCPELQVCCVRVENISSEVSDQSVIEQNITDALSQLSQFETESSIPSIGLWRSAYRKVGIEPTKYRMAAESLLRRLRKKGDLPNHLHPLVLICNSMSVKYHLPIAALDATQINGHLEVAFTRGNENYTTFQREDVSMPPEEVSFIDEHNVAHARKWSNKQNAISVITNNTNSALITIESLLPSNTDSIEPIVEELVDSLKIMWPNSDIYFEIKSANKLKSEKFNLYQ